MTNDPPKITNISDSIYLMDTIWPAYQEYVHKGGKKSLWQLYSADQKKTILELFRDPIILIDGDSAITIHRDQQYFDAFTTNEEFLECLCSEFGFPDVVSAERAFKAIKFVPFTQFMSIVKINGQYFQTRNTRSLFSHVLRTTKSQRLAYCLRMVHNSAHKRQIFGRNESSHQLPFNGGRKQTFK